MLLFVIFFSCTFLSIFQSALKVIAKNRFSLEDIRRCEKIFFEVVHSRMLQKSFLNVIFEYESWCKMIHGKNYVKGNAKSFPFRCFSGKCFSSVWRLLNPKLARSLEEIMRLVSASTLSTQSTVGSIERASPYKLMRWVGDYCEH